MSVNVEEETRQGQMYYYLLSKRTLLLHIPSNKTTVPQTKKILSVTV